MRGVGNSNQQTTAESGGATLGTLVMGKISVLIVQSSFLFGLRLPGAKSHIN